MAFYSVDGDIVALDPSDSEDTLFDGGVLNGETSELDDVPFSEDNDESDVLQDEILSEEQIAEIIDNRIASSGYLSSVSEVNALQASVLNDASTAYGTFNSQVLDLCDRIVDGYPEGYEYVAFRTSTTDSYNTTLYIGKHGFAQGSRIAFDGPADEITFTRTTGTNAHLYVSSRSVDSPSVNVSYDSIVYSNTRDGLPILGTSHIDTSNLLILPFLLAVVAFIIGRKI